MMYFSVQRIKKSVAALFSCFLVFLFPVVAFAFNNPPGNPPTGSGSIVTNASNDVGIGTTNPGSRLTVRDAVAGTVFAIRNTADTANTFAVSDTGAITSGSMAWSLLTNFPAGCPAGQAVQVIGAAPTCIAVGTGTVTSVTATDPLASSGGATPNISLIGMVGATNGGTAQSTYATGDLLYASGVNTLAKRIIGSAGQVLTVSGGVPVWANEVGDISGVTAGAGLSGGGVSGAVTLNLVTPVAATNGGTGQSTYTTGDILFSSSANVLARRVIGSAGQVLTVSGGVPVWAAPATGIASLNAQAGATQTFANDTNIIISSSLNTHTLGWSGTLSVARGGTGASTAATARTNLGAAASGANSDITSLSGLTTSLSATQGGTAQSTYATGDLLYASGVNTLAKRIIGSAGQVLTVSGGVPTWATPASGIGGSGTTNYVPKFTAASTVGNSQIYDTGANVGIGTAAPVQKLELSGGFLVQNNNTYYARNNVGTMEIFLTPRGADNISYMNFGSGGLNIRNNSSLSRIFVQDAGNVGIGNTAPAQKLDVTGTVQMTGFKLTAGAVNGYVLKSDAAGVGTWQVPGGMTTLNAQSGASQQFGNDTNVTITSNANTHTLGWSGQLSVARGGTGATTASGARTNLGAAASGANSDITSLTGLTTDLSVAQGGTGLSSPGASGNVLTSNGAAWVSQAETGDISGVTAGTGLTGGGATGAVTLNLATPVTAANGGTGLTTTGAASQLLGMNTTATGLEYKSLIAGSNITITPNPGSITISSTGGGEVNTASNVGVGGVGVYKQKTGVNLEFKNINAAASGRVSVVNDAVNNEVDVDVLESALTHDNIGGTLGVAKGGTGATTASGARTNLGAAASGANSDIISLSGLTTSLSVVQGGTGAATLPANNVLLGNGTAAVQAVAPGTSGNVLTSNGATWVSQAPTGTFSSYEIVSAGSTADAGSFTPIATCSAGKKVVGGGCTSGAPTVCRVTHSYPNTDSSWYCAEYHYEAAAICGYTQAWAICM